MTMVSPRFLTFSALLLVASVSSAAFAQATASAHGRVIDGRSRAALASVEVIVDGSSLRTRTGSDGAWTLADVPAGSHQLRVRRLGYANRNFTLPFVAATDTGIVIALTPSPRPLDAVVVTAARREQRLKDVVSSTELVSREDIETTGSTDIESVLAEQTGIQFTGGHPSGSGVALEGLSDQRVLVLVDGLPLYGRISGGLDLSRIPTSAVERIEVVKGPQSTLYGSEAMGGVVNIITRNPLTAAQSDAEVRTTVGTDNRIDSDVFGSLRRGNVSAVGNFGHRYSERTPGISSEAGALTDRLDGLATLRWTPVTPLALEASTLVLNERQRWLDGTQYSFADNTQRNGRLSAAWTTPAQRVSGSISLSELNHLSRASEFTSPIAGTGDRQIQRLEQAEGLYSHTLQNVVLDAGALVRHEYIMSTDGRVSGGSRTLNSAEPYAQAEWTVGRLSLVPGARLSWNEQWGSYASPRLALRFQADSSLTFRASVGRGFRAPDFKELYLDFTNNSAFYGVRGNPDLRPEHSDNVSVGVDWNGDRLSGRAHLYWSELYDFIETVPLSTSGGFSQYSYSNVDRAMTRGIELESGVTLGVLRAQAGYAHLTSFDRSANGPLLGQPANSGRLLLSGPIPLGVLATATAVYTGRTPMQFGADGAVSDWRDAYSRLDVRAARRLLGRANVSVGVDNVFNAQPARWADVTVRQVYLGVALTLRPAAE